MTKIREGYKETEIGVIPEDWEVVTLDKYVKSNSYGPRFNAKLYDDNGNCRVIRGTDVKQNGVVDYSNIPVAQIDDDVLEKHRLQKNDFVVVTTADCGVSFVFNEEGIFMPSAYMVRLRFSNEVNSDYLCNYFETTVIKKQVASHIRRGTIANLPGSDLLRFKAPLPPLQEQQRIAEILSTTDSHVEKLDKTIEDYQLLKKGMMKKLLTEGIGHSEFKETEIGIIPKDWEVVPLSEVAEIVSGGTPKTSVSEYWDCGDVMWATPTDITSNGKYITKTEKMITKVGLKNSSATLLPIGTILMTSRATIGERCINKCPMSTNQGFKSFICKQNCHNEFLYYYIEILKPEIIKNSSGSTFLEISKSKLEVLTIALPSIKEQKIIAEILSDIDEIIYGIENERFEFLQLKKSLMEKLLTGKIRVDLRSI